MEHEAFAAWLTGVTNMAYHAPNPYAAEHEPAVPRNLDNERLFISWFKAADTGAHTRLDRRCFSAPSSFARSGKQVAKQLRGTAEIAVSPLVCWSVHNSHAYSSYELFEYLRLW